MDLTATTLECRRARGGGRGGVGASSRSAPARSGRSAARRPPGAEVRAPAGVVAYEPADLTVTVGAGTTVAELDAALGATGQECPLDPRDAAATVGGIIACGLSGHRRLRHGPLRDHVLEVRFVTADGRLVQGGAPVVKNVTGYDLPRLFVGSFGTLGVLVQVTLRCRPRPAATAWATVDAPPDRVRRRVFAPSTLLWDGADTHVLLEGDTRDVDAQLAALGATVDERVRRWPDGRAPRPHLGPARRARRARRARSTRSPGAAGRAKSASAPCTSRPTRVDGARRGARSRRTPRAVGCCARRAAAPARRLRPRRCPTSRSRAG